MGALAGAGTLVPWWVQEWEVKVTVTRVALSVTRQDGDFSTPCSSGKPNSDVHLEARCQLIFRMSESRTELIAWVNDLLQLNYTKVEQCGTGGAYCQIMDSVYGELELSVEAKCP